MAEKTYVDLNADLGESFGCWTLGDDVGRGHYGHPLEGTGQESKTLH